ncbi:putative phosphoglycerate mutase [Chondrocystis sp. NIES-4102]|nr:putative phosphoglycerate mutase [Chondrocystis sp. NIES-4102]
MNNLLSSSTKVILVRHARTTYNEQGRYQGSSDESRLTEKGYKDALATGLALQEYDFDAIYLSPLTRVKQTTEAIITVLKQNKNYIPPIFTDHRLTEIKMSDWQGLLYQEVKEKYVEAANCWQNTPHLFNFNDTFFPVIDLFEQVTQFWQKLLTKHRGETILIVAHGGTNRALISTAVGLNPEYYHSLQQSNCGISCLEFLPNSKFAQLKYLNFTTQIKESLPKLKAGKTGWRWLLLSNAIAFDLCDYSYLTQLVKGNLINFLLSDDTQASTLLSQQILNFNPDILHLHLAQNHFLTTWQQTIYNKQKLNNNSESSNDLVTGLIITDDHHIKQIIQKTFKNKTSLNTVEQLVVIHYPHKNCHPILQGILPINNLLSPQLN